MTSVSATINPFAIIVIGASAGAFRALRQILPALSSPLPVDVVVHVSAEHPSRLPEGLAPHARLPIKEAEDKEHILPWLIYLAPAGYHLLVERDQTFALSQDDPVYFCRPSIDVLFESVADAFGAHALAVLLTGANEDGAAGLASITQEGGTTIVQDPVDAEVSTMPEAAIKLRAPTMILRLDEIAAFLARMGVHGS